MTEKRREALVRMLRESDEPLTGAQLAQVLKVSRQVIVQDIAVLRAGGIQVVGGLSGYWIPAEAPKALKKTFVSKHMGDALMEEELQIVVDYGGRMLSIAVNHPLYGDIVCPLVIKSREDIRKFMERLKDEKAAPLSSLTEGVHFHTVEIDTEEAYQKMYEQLKKRGFVPE